MRTFERQVAAPALQVEERTPNLTWFWTACGAASIGIFVYVMTAWVASGDFKRTPTGADPVPAMTKVWAVTYQVAGVLLLVGAIIYFWRRTKREGFLSLEATVFIAWTITVWMDPASNNYIRPQLLYNSYLINFGSWGPHIPGWLSANGHLLPEPIVAYSGIYGTQLAFNLVGCWAMRRAKARWPHLSKVGLFGCGMAVLAVLDLIVEVTVIRGGLYAYPGGIRSLSLFGGTQYQFPVYEMILFPGILMAVSCVMFFKDDKGRSPLERGVDEAKIGRARFTLVRLLTVTGFTTVSYIAYAVFWCWASVYGGPYSPDFKSYMLNGMCGPGTQYECMGPHTPIVLPGSGPTRVP